VVEYIDWAIGKNFGVIDVNVPRHITHPEVSLLYLHHVTAPRMAH
jgi:hypothetical protein